jgi:glycosyltransferase involved in cell wall biosynthesis
MRVLQVNAAYAADLVDPDALLERYEILTGWSEALLAADAAAVCVLQRFHRNAHIRREGVDYFFCADRQSPGAPGSAWLGHLYQRAAAWRPDIVHVNGLNLATQCLRLRRSLPSSAAICVQDHAGAAPDWGRGVRRWLRRARARRGLAAVDGFLFTARELARPWIDAGVIQRSQAIVEVPAASTRFRLVARGEARAVSGIDGDPALLWVGRLARVKDPLTVLSGVAKAAVRLPGITLTMVHNGGELVADVHRAIASEAALQRRVRVVTGVPRAVLPAYFSAADAFVLGSLHEACGLALLEALACGATPVVPAIPAFQSLIGGASVGALWAPGDSGALADALVEAHARGVFDRRDRVIAHFAEGLTWGAVGRQAMAAYTQIAAAKSCLTSSPSASS